MPPSQLRCLGRYARSTNVWNQYHGFLVGLLLFTVEW